MKKCLLCQQLVHLPFSLSNQFQFKQNLVVLRYVQFYISYFYCKIKGAWICLFFFANVHSLQGFCCEKRFDVPTIGLSTFFHIKSILIQTKPYIFLRCVQFYMSYFCCRIERAWILFFLLTSTHCKAFVVRKGLLCQQIDILLNIFRNPFHTYLTLRLCFQVYNAYIDFAY